MALQTVFNTFEFAYTEEGVIARILDYPTDVAELHRVIVEHAKRKGLQGLMLSGIQSLLQSRADAIILAKSQPEQILQEEVRVEVRTDETDASMILLPPDVSGRRILREKIVQAVREAGGLVNGLDEQAIYDAWDQAQYYRSIVIANATQPVHGEDGSVQYHFQREHSRSPRELERGRVDFYDLDLFEPVETGQLLVTLIPPTLGEDGVGVRGKVLKAKPGKEVRMPRGDGVEISEDGLSMTAAKSGCVDIRDQKVIVSDVYVIKGNADMSVGHLQFAGDIMVHGDVISGIKLQAEGSIEVRGMVEASTLIAGGNVMIQKGIQGMDRGLVEAGGDVIAKFIERSHIKAGGFITADSVRHSELECQGDVLLEGRHGSVIGGSIRAFGSVTATSVGSHSHAMTQVGAGISPNDFHRNEEISQRMSAIDQEKEKLVTLCKGLQQRVMQNMADTKTAEMLKKVNESNNILDQEMAALKDELKQITVSLQQVPLGKVHVRGTIFEGAVVQLGKAMLAIRKDMQFATYRLAEGEIAMGVCEA